MAVGNSLTRVLLPLFKPVYSPDSLLANHIASHSKVAASVAQLDLSANDLGVEGGKALAPAIRVSRTLTQVLALSPHSLCGLLNLAASNCFADQPEFKQVVWSLETI